MCKSKNKRVVIAMVAGEESGDIIGSDLVRELKTRVGNIHFMGIGGTRMRQLGFESLYDIDLLSIRGYVEVLKSLPKLFFLRKTLKKTFINIKPDLFIGIDAPDFNLELERSLKKVGIPTIHYVSPSIWAWRPNRIKKIKESVELMLTVFPFEGKIYENNGVPHKFVGHPLADRLNIESNKNVRRDYLKIADDVTVVALLPGSRVHEVVQLGELMIQAACLIKNNFPQTIFLTPIVSKRIKNMFDQLLISYPELKGSFKLLHGHSDTALAASDAAIIASGTATLEASLIGVPMVITYKMPKLSELIMRSKKTDLRYIGLPNILRGSYIVPEIILDDATADNLSQAICNILNDRELQIKLRMEFKKIRESLRCNASIKAADAVMDMLDLKI